MLYIIAAGERIDPDRVPNFSYETAEIFRDPFETAEKTLDQMTAAEIKEYVKKRLEEFAHGSAQAGGKN